MGQSNFKKHFKFHNFNEIFYFGMTRLNLSVLFNVNNKNHFKKYKYWTEPI